MNNPTLLQADTSLKKGDLQTALRLYQEVISADSQNALAYENVSIILGDLGRDNEALDMSAKALELDPSLIIPHITRAYILDRLDRKEESRVEIQKALEKDPESPEALCCLGILLFTENKIDDAKRYLEKAVEIRPSYYLAQYHVNLVYYRLRNARKVVSQSLVLFRLEPNIANFLRFTYLFSRLPLFRVINLLILLFSSALALLVGPRLILIVTFLLVCMSLLGGIFIGFLAKGTQWVQFAYSLILGFSFGIVGLILYVVINYGYSR